jgi:hypothetical protein
MVSSNPEGPDSKKPVKSLRDLPQDIPPPRDLWSGIEAQLPPRAPRARGWLSPLPLAGAAAVVAALAIGIWIGRTVFPGWQAPPQVSAGGQKPEAAEMMRAAYVTDPRYLRERAQLVRSLEERLAALPPESRANVLASLETIRRSMKDIEAALGRNPGNALLQELLVNTYQDEMRVLTAVQEASGAGEEI